MVLLMPSYFLLLTSQLAIHHMSSQFLLIPTTSYPKLMLHITIYFRATCGCISKNWDSMWWMASCSGNSKNMACNASQHPEPKFKNYPHIQTINTCLQLPSTSKTNGNCNTTSN